MPGAIAKELLALEVALATRDESAIPGGFAGVIDPEFVEFGSSGRVWDRTTILEALVPSGDGGMTIEDFMVHPLATDVVLATFRTTQARASGEPLRRLRSSIWIRRGQRWRLRFHQGTPVAG